MTAWRKMYGKTMTARKLHLTMFDKKTNDKKAVLMVNLPDYLDIDGGSLAGFDAAIGYAAPYLADAGYEWEFRSSDEISGFRDHNFHWCFL